MAIFSSKKTLFEAAMIGDIDELTYCLDSKKYNINTKDASGDTVLHVAVAFGQVDAVKVIAARRPDFEALGKAGLPPLMLAMEKENKPAMALAIIAGGANPNTHDANYVYPLHKAAAAGEMDIVAALVNAGADVNARTRDTEDTPLHYAIASGRRGVAEFLVKRGARTDIAGKDGKTAIQLSIEQGPSMHKVVDPRASEKELVPKVAMEFWDLVTPTQVSKTSNLPALSRKITEIFNFETRERVTISQNLKTGAESVGESEPFTAIAEDALETAKEKLKLLGGKMPGAAPPKKIADSPVGKFSL